MEHKNAPASLQLPDFDAPMTLKKRSLFLAVVEGEDNGDGTGSSYIHIERNMSEQDLAFAAIGILNELLENYREEDVPPDGNVAKAFKALRLLHEATGVTATAQERIKE